jgi:hypothetical protein
MVTATDSRPGHKNAIANEQARKSLRAPFSPARIERETILSRIERDIDEHNKQQNADTSAN